MPSARPNAWQCSLFVRARAVGNNLRGKFFYRRWNQRIAFALERIAWCSARQGVEGVGYGRIEPVATLLSVFWSPAACRTGKA
jgi:hypothetical protein